MNESLASMETIAEKECVDLLERHHLGRIVLLAGEQPLIFPVNYAYGDRVIAFRTGPGIKLATASHAHVAFEIDDFDPHTGAGWSVVVQGVAYEITDAVDRQSQLARRLHVRPLAPGQRDHWIGDPPHRNERPPLPNHGLIQSISKAWKARDGLVRDDARSMGVTSHVRCCAAARARQADPAQ